MRLLWFVVLVQSSLGQSNGTLNLLWPGSSWASIACGAQYQQLVQQGYQIQHIMGASGGASSAAMMLSDPNPQSLTVLRNTYGNFSQKCSFDTNCWKNVYLNLFENADGTTPGAFERVKQFGKVSLVCDGTHYVLHNFVDAEQAAQAYAASGGGPIEVKGVGTKCNDGGLVNQAFPDSMKGDKLGYFATTSPGEGNWNFPAFCPNSLNLIVANGYKCLDYLITVDRIHPEKYTSLDPPGIPGLKVYGAYGPWKDCSAGTETPVFA